MLFLVFAFIRNDVPKILKKNNLNTRKRFPKLGQILKKQIVKCAHGKIGAKNSAGKHKKIINKNTARNFKPGSL